MVDTHYSMNLKPWPQISRPKFYRYWSEKMGFTHVLTGICREKFFLTLI